MGRPEAADRIAPKSKRIRFPFARSATGGAVSIHDYHPGDPVTCFGCERKLIAKRGQKVTWHFAHATDIAATCSGETALHRLSKVLLRDSHKAARQTGHPYLLRWLCQHCHKHQLHDCAKHSSEVELEGEPTAGVRCDALFVGDRPFALEVIVTHDIEAETLARYAASNVPVFTFRPTWETVGQLRKIINASETYNLQTDRCLGCRALRQRAEQVDKQHRRLVLELGTRRLSDLSRAQQALKNWPPSQDRFGRALFPHVQDKVRAQAVRLIRLGFCQMERNPWVFSMRLPVDAGYVYAGLGGDEYENPLWRSVAVSLFGNLRVPRANLDRFGDAIVAFLQANQVSVHETWPEQLTPYRPFQGERRADWPGQEHP